MKPCKAMNGDPCSAPETKNEYDDSSNAPIRESKAHSQSTLLRAPAATSGHEFYPLPREQSSSMVLGFWLGSSPDPELREVRHALRSTAKTKATKSTMSIVAMSHSYGIV